MMHPCFLFLEGGGGVGLTFGWELTTIFVYLKRLIFPSTQNGSLPGEVSNFDKNSVRGIKLDAYEKRWGTFQRGKNKPSQVTKLHEVWVAIRHGFREICPRVFFDTKDGFGGRHGVTVGDLLFRVDSPSTPVDG